MTRFLDRACIAALLCVALASCSGSKQEESASASSAPAPMEGTQTAEAPVARGKAAAIHVALSVEAVDHEKRLITLKGPQGNVGVYEVGDQVKRLSEIKAGDKINAQYEVAATAELREPTAEEKTAPMVEVASGARGAADEPPAAAIARAVRAVTTIEALDRPGQTLTVKDPVEGLVTLHVEDPSVFDKLQVGQTIVVTFAETLALAVEPGAKK